MDVLRVDRPVPLGTPNRAKKTLPRSFEIKESHIPKAGLGVFYKGKKELPIGTRFGPYEGVEIDKEEAEKSGYSWVIRKKNGYVYIDAKDETQSNWMRYVNCARNERELNLIALQYRQAVVYHCCRPVRRGEELLVWYGDEYGKELGIVFDKMWDEKSSAKVGEGSQSSQTQVFSCPECPYAFTCQVFLHGHLKRSHNDLYWQMLRSGQILPAACQQTSTTSSVPRQTQGDTGHTVEKPFLCRLCDTRFTHSGHLNRHQLLHTGEKPFHCGLCDKRFTQSGHLKTHQHVHTGDKPYPCTQCDKRFTQSGHLKTHQRVHTGEKPYTCTQCDKRFSDSGSLKTHQRVHTGEKPFHCKQCGKSFARLVSLKNHQLLHTGEKPFHCGLCDKTFTLLHHLKTHQRVHTGEKPYPCTQCSKRFTQLSNLKTHQRFHTGEKPYRCTHCDKGFTTSRNLRQHQQVHTVKKTFPL